MQFPALSTPHTRPPGTAPGGLFAFRERILLTEHFSLHQHNPGRGGCVGDTFSPLTGERTRTNGQSPSPYSNTPPTYGVLSPTNY